MGEEVFWLLKWYAWQKSNHRERLGRLLSHFMRWWWSNHYYFYFSPPRNKNKTSFFKKTNARWCLDIPEPKDVMSKSSCQKCREINRRGIKRSITWALSLTDVKKSRKIVTTFILKASSQFFFLHQICATLIKQLTMSDYDVMNYETLNSISF